MRGMGESAGALFMVGAIIGATPALAAEREARPAVELAQASNAPAVGTGGRTPGSGAPITLEQKPGEDIAGEKDSERLIDAFRPKGIRVGDFLLFPKVEAGVGYNSNVFAQQTGAKGDFVSSVQPEFTLRSQLPVHMLTLSGNVQGVKYARFSSDDQVNGRATAEGRYDILRDWSVSAKLDFLANHEDRATPDARQGRDPTPTKTLLGQLGTTYQSGDYTLSGFLEADRRTYGDVATDTGRLFNGDRDQWETRARVRGAYEFIPSYQWIAEVEGNRRVRDQAVDRSGFRRDSSGYRVNSGLGVEITQVLRGDFLVGFLQQDFDDPRFKSPSGISIKSSVTWTPDKLTVVVPAIERTVNETTLINASSRVRTAATVLVRHEYARNVLLTAFGGFYYDEYQGVNQNSTSFDARFRALYAFGPELYLVGEVEYKSRNSDLFNNNYDQLVVGMRVGFQF